MLIRIMWCKEREDNINKMLSSLGQPAEVIWDEDHNACHTLCRVLDSDEDMLVMEDDIELCKDFYEKAMKEIQEHPDCFCMFYCTGQWEKEAPHDREIKKPYNRPYVYTQAYYVPKWIGKKLVEHLREDYHANHRRWSIWINKFLRENNIPRYLAYPSMVQHISTSSILEPEAIFPIHHSKSYKYE